MAAEVAQAGRPPTSLHELRAWRDRLHAILQLVTDAIVVVDFTGAVVYVNAPACAILAIEQPTDVIGRPLDALYAHRVVLTADGARVAAHDLPGKRAFDGEASQDVLLRFGDEAGGDERVAIVRSAPIWDASRHVIALIQVFRDVTAEHRTRSRLELLSTASRAIGTDAPAGIVDLVRLPTAQLADWCFVDIRDDEGRFRRLAIACASADDETLAATLPRVLTLDASELEPRAGPIAPRELEALLGDRRAAPLAARLRSRLTTAIQGRDRPIGALTMLSCREAFDDADAAFAVGLARIAAAALEHIRLFDAERSAAERLRFLARATERLASTIDYEATLRNVVDVTLPTLADCVVLELDGEEPPRRLVAAPEDPLAARVLENGTTVRAALVELETSSVVEIPLTARGSQLGTLTLIHGRSRRVHGPEEAALARELATRAAAALEQARLYRAAHEANRLKDEFIATVSHELRTPLNAIKGWAGILVRRRDPDVIAHGLAIIDRNAKAQARLIDDILDVSRILSGKLKIDRAPVDLVPLVREVIDSLRPAADAKEIALAIDDGTGMCATIGDRERLRQVVWNLVTNAIKFTNVGGRVVLRLSCDESAAQMAVTDSGAGIAPTLLPFVFDRFRQGDGSTTRRHGGLGLGLAIVRHIVELHGGRVTAASDGPGKGAVFEVFLPTCVPADEARAPASSSGPPHRSADGRTLEGVRVLVVDDDHDARELLQTLLAEAGALVKTAASAAQAMEALGAEGFDVLVSDIAMPDEDGYALIRRVRALPRDAGGGIAAVAVTAFAQAQDRVRALAAGFTSWVSKPVYGDELVATVEGLASLARRAPRE